VATIDGSLADGRYAARWQAAGDDGHVQKGEYVFTIRRTK
jgi:methionine-rich copper-binding protein CopC